MAQSVSGAWDALYAALQGLFPASSGWFVSAGDPGDYQPDMIVAMMGVRCPITQPTLSTNRSRDKRIEIDVVFSVYVAGGTEAQQPANQAAWAAVDALETYLRTSPNEKLGGACYNAFVSAMPLEVDIAWEAIDGVANLVPAGRTATVDVNVEIWVRLS